MESSGPSVASVVHVVDDGADLLQSLVFLFDSVGIEALTYDDADTFLREFDPEEPAVLIVDMRMPGMNGFQLQEQLAARDYPAPIIFCSAHGDIAMSVRALRQGAVDFLEKPYEPQRMLDTVQEHLRTATDLFAEARARREVRKRLESLTPRERDVLRLVLNGTPSQLIARELGASVKTIDVHRARIKAKTEAESLGALVRDILHHHLEI